MRESLSPPPDNPIRKRKYNKTAPQSNHSSEIDELESDSDQIQPNTSFNNHLDKYRHNTQSSSSAAYNRPLSLEQRISLQSVPNSSSFPSFPMSEMTNIPSKVTKPFSAPRKSAGSKRGEERASQATLNKLNRFRASQEWGEGGDGERVWSSSSQHHPSSEAIAELSEEGESVRPPPTRSRSRPFPRPNPARVEKKPVEEEVESEQAKKKRKADRLEEVKNRARKVVKLTGFEFDSVKTEVDDQGNKVVKPTSASLTGIARKKAKKAAVPKGLMSAAAVEIDMNDDLDLDDCDMNDEDQIVGQQARNATPLPSSIELAPAIKSRLIRTSPSQPPSSSAAPPSNKSKVTPKPKFEPLRPIINKTPIVPQTKTPNVAPKPICVLTPAQKKNAPIEKMTSTDKKVLSSDQQREIDETLEGIDLQDELESSDDEPIVKKKTPVLNKSKLTTTS